MPCDLGYKEVAKIRVPQPLPKELRIKTKPPEIDQDLLEKIGEEDQVFAEWLKELDIQPLFQEALKRAQSVIKEAALIDLRIAQDGSLELKAKFRSNEEKRRLETLAEQVSGRYQMEVFKIIAELLDYEVTISQQESGQDRMLKLEGEKHQEESEVHKYLAITLGADGEGVFRFEHFDSSEALEGEKQKFLGLAQKLGIKANWTVTERRGQPIPHGSVHKHFLKIEEGEKNAE